MATPTFYDTPNFITAPNAPDRFHPRVASPKNAPPCTIGELANFVLPNSSLDVLVQPNGTLSASNDYGVAVAQCSVICDEWLACLSFNVYTEIAADFNDCTPTYQCRFSNNTFNASDYTARIVGGASYAWSLEAIQPEFNFASSSLLSPAAWVNLGIDQYLKQVARIQGIYEETSDFTLDLLNVLGYNGPMCLDDTFTNCAGGVSVTNVAEWVNYQTYMYQTYMKNYDDILNKIVTQVGFTGHAIFDSLWSSEAPPSSPTFDPLSLIIEIVNGAIGAIPEVGGVAEALARNLEAYVGGHANPTPVPIVPNESSSWDEFMSQIANQINAAQQTIDQASLAATTSYAGFFEVFSEGVWSLTGDASTNAVPAPADVWTATQPFYEAMVAMQAMAAQSVIFMSVPATLNSPSDLCTQSLADEFASYFSGSANGAAWCYYQQVIIPVMGYNNDVYSLFPSVIQTVQANRTQILESSSKCYPGFGVSTMNIQLYHSPDVLPTIVSPGEIYFDMTQPCAWNVPICDYSTWYALAKHSGPPTGYNPSNREKLTNTAQYCAWNMNMINAGSKSGVTIPVDKGTSWKPTPVATVVPLY
ncbi:hypothetical protein MMC26_002928 [Xylographa opegraphella]|nr:hypothetical protein [Xylographa opegraphella]